MGIIWLRWRRFKAGRPSTAIVMEKVDFMVFVSFWCLFYCRAFPVSAEEAKLFLSNQESVDQETFIEKTWKVMKPFVEREAGMYQPPTEAESAPEHEDLEQPDDEEEHEDGK